MSPSYVFSNKLFYLGLNFSGNQTADKISYVSSDRCLLKFTVLYISYQSLLFDSGTVIAANRGNYSAIMLDPVKTPHRIVRHSAFKPATGLTGLFCSK